MKSAGLFAVSAFCAVLSYRAIQPGANLPAAAQQANRDPLQCVTAERRT